MPRRPTILPPRPTTATCRCGAVYAVAPKGPEPLLCPRCARERVEVAEALRVLRAAVARSGRIETGEPGSDAAMLRALAERIERRSVRSEIEDGIDRLDVEGLGSADEARLVARRLEAARSRLLSAHGLRPRQIRAAERTARDPRS